VVDDALLDHFVVEGTFEELPDLLLRRYSALADRLVLYFAGAAWERDPLFFERCGQVARDVAGRSSATSGEAGSADSSGTGAPRR
jgi:hypothetical protein